MDVHFLSKESTALLLVDVQEKLFCKIAKKEEVLSKILILLKACHLLNIPIFISEQYPQGLGRTVDQILKLLHDELKIKPPIFEKTTFSCMQESLLQEALFKTQVQDILVIGIETHICVLQTAKDLLKLGKRVVIPIDATSSRDLENVSIAKEELRSAGARITSVETCLFELVRDAKAQEFKPISQLVK